MQAALPDYPLVLSLSLSSQDPNIVSCIHCESSCGNITNAFASVFLRESTTHKKGHKKKGKKERGFKIGRGEKVAAQMSRAFVEHGQEPRLLFAFLRRTFHRRAVRAYSGRSRVTQIHCFQWLMESGFHLRLWRSAVIKASFLFLDTWRPFRAQNVVAVEERRGWITRESALCRMSAR